MAKNIMIQGTMSSAGKSYIVTGLCRYYARLGYKVAPFKSQNMALNSYITVDGLEMGRAQVAQAEAAGVLPNVYMNPILLKPTTDVGSQVIVNGVSIGNMKAKEYFEYKKSLVPTVLEAYKKLESENDIVIIEGAGSPAEINLKSNDIVNMGLAKLVDAPVVLVGDIDPGGVFAQLYGTVELLSDDEKDRIKGLIINKFRGDVSLLDDGLRMLEDKCGKPVLGVVPMSKAKIDEEDSITSAFNGNIKDDTLIDIAVIRLPRISNFTDFKALSIADGVSVRYVEQPGQLGSPDMIVLPGTKSTISDLRWLKDTGLFDMIRGLSRDTLIFGICGGYQMLGKVIEDPLGIEGEGSEEGLSLLPIRTVYEENKIKKLVKNSFNDVKGQFSFLNGVEYVGYEIHNGVSSYIDADCCENAFGTYVHGVFDSAKVIERLIDFILSRKGLIRNNNTIMQDYYEYKLKQYDIIADELAASLDFDKLNKIIGI